MNLRDYLYHNRITVTNMAAELGYTRTHLSTIVNGKSKPSPRLARDIEKFTNGIVTAKQLLKEKK